MRFEASSLHLWEWIYRQLVEYDLPYPDVIYRLSHRVDRFLSSVYHEYPDLNRPVFFNETFEDLSARISDETTVGMAEIAIRWYAFDSNLHIFFNSNNPGYRHSVYSFRHPILRGHHYEDYISPDIRKSVSHFRRNVDIRDGAWISS